MVSSWFGCAFAFAFTTLNRQHLYSRYWTGTSLQWGARVGEYHEKEIKVAP